MAVAAGTETDSSHWWIAKKFAMFDLIEEKTAMTKKLLVWLFCCERSRMI